MTGVGIYCLTLSRSTQYRWYRVNSTLLGRSQPAKLQEAPQTLAKHRSSKGLSKAPFGNFFSNWPMQSQESKVELNQYNRYMVSSTVTLWTPEE